MEYLSKLSEVLVILLCREDYGNCKPVRHLLKEVGTERERQTDRQMPVSSRGFCVPSPIPAYFKVLSRHVLYPAIDLVTDPEYINTKVLSYIKKHQVVYFCSSST